MSLPRLHVDFVAPRRRSAAPWLLAVTGALAMAATLYEQHALDQEAMGLELRIAAASPADITTTAAPDRSLSREAQMVSQRLATPWGGMLDDLEAAGRDEAGSIAVLSVQPDREARRVTLVAEARSLPAALNYVQRLQRSRSLRHPMLDSHDVRTDSPERPVRIQITSEWKMSS